MLCLIPLGALLLLLAQNVPGFAEGYAAAVYPVWSRGVNFVTSLLPFSLAEFLVYLAVPAALFFLIRFAARMIGGKGRRGRTDQPVPNPAGGCEQRAPAGAGG